MILYGKLKINLKYEDSLRIVLLVKYYCASGEGILALAQTETEFRSDSTFISLFLRFITF